MEPVCKTDNEDVDLILKRNGDMLEVASICNLALTLLHMWVTAVIVMTHTSAWACSLSAHTHSFVWVLSFLSGHCTDFLLLCKASTQFVTFNIGFITLKGVYLTFNCEQKSNFHLGTCFPSGFAGFLYLYCFFCVLQGFCLFCCSIFAVSLWNLSSFCHFLWIFAGFCHCHCRIKRVVVSLQDLQGFCCVLAGVVGFLPFPCVIYRHFSIFL